MGLDAQGVYQYTGEELGAPGGDFQNLGMQSVSTQFADVRSEIAGLALLTDSDWVPITSLGTGWTATVNYPHRLRKVGNRVDISGALTAASGFQVNTLLTLPVGFRPNYNSFLAYVKSSTAGGSTYASQLHISGTTGVLSWPASYGTGVLAVGGVCPLVGSWYV